MGSVWVQVVTNGGGRVGGAVKIKPVPEDVADLCEAVKAKMVNDLAHCDAHHLVVFPPGANIEEQKEALRPGAAPPSDTTDEKPMIVVAPPAKEQSGA